MKSKLPVTVVPAAKKLRVDSSVSLTPELVRHKIMVYRSLDLASDSLEVVTRAVARLLLGYAITTVQLRPAKIYRARKRTGPTPFTNARELWYVPLDKAHLVSMGRLNQNGEVVFYCTDNPDVALVEVRPSVGDRICMLECDLRPDKWMRLMPIGIHQHVEVHKPEFASHAYEDKEHKEQFVKPENLEAIKILQDFLVAELVRIVPDEARHLYKTTVALAHLLLPAELKLDGLAYPSVAANLRGMNFMLTCAAADELLVPTQAWELHLFEETGPLAFNARSYSALNGIGPSGELSWPPLLS